MTRKATMRYYIVTNDQTVTWFADYDSAVREFVRLARAKDNTDGSLYLADKRTGKTLNEK